MANDKVLAKWSFRSERDAPSALGDILADGERLLCAYSTIRDFAAFTDRRLIVRDAQGLTGAKSETVTLPYRSIIMYTIENAAGLDHTSELTLLTTAGSFVIELGRGCDVKKLERLLASRLA